MSDSSQQEPSIEEILASIRKIISEDDEQDGEKKSADPDDVQAVDGVEGDTPEDEISREDMEAALASADDEDNDGADDTSVDEDADVAAATDDDEAGDVIELTEMVQDDGSVVSLAGEEEAAGAPEPEPEPAPESGPAPKSEPEPAPASAPAASLDDVASEALVSAGAAAVASSAFARLGAQSAPKSEGLGTMPVGTATVEDIVRELLRPMLKEWLDSNLAPMVERIVQEEVERVSRRMR